MIQGSVLIDGRKIATYVAGEGDITYVFVHGGPGGRSDERFGDLLSEYGKVFMYDQSGGGRSDPVPDLENLEPGLYIDELGKVLSTIEGKYVLIGYSWGAVPVVGYAASCNDPDLVSTVFLSPFLDGTLWSEDQFRNMEDIDKDKAVLFRKYAEEEYVGPEFLELLKDYFYRYLYMEEPNRIESTKHAHVPVGKICLRLWGKNDAVPIGPLKDHSSLDLLGKIKVPSLWICGGSDSVRPETLRKMAEMAGSDDIVVIPDAGHYSIREIPEEFIKAIVDFVSEKSL
ncbi:MAG: alpha/beta fold hydrolase [archaeon]|nr:alpha/beta fold hydrolase [archaeon]